MLELSFPHVPPSLARRPHLQPLSAPGTALRVLRDSSCMLPLPSYIPSAPQSHPRRRSIQAYLVRRHTCRGQLFVASFSVSIRSLHPLPPSAQSSYKLPNLPSGALLFRPASPPHLVCLLNEDLCRLHIHLDAVGLKVNIDLGIVRRREVHACMHSGGMLRREGKETHV